jgi:D-3-phosphoglycerate dehydrogenase
VATILVTETIAEQGLDILRGAGHEVRVATGLGPGELLEAVVDVHALIIRSATQVTADVIAHAPRLVVIGRAGIGLDNVDIEAATRAGVMVVNAPQSNIISAAEHTIALMLALARHLPQAHASVVAGEWRRSSFEGAELYGKTLGIIGLGRIGALVAQRALAFGMTLVAYDPYISQERASKMGVRLVALEELMETADFVTIHLPKSKETKGLVGKELLARAKPGIRIVNAARGGIIDEDALYQALVDGRVAGAALDVFATEPPKGSPLLGLTNVVLTPHLGASTEEAQNKAGVTIAEQVQLALANEFVPFAVNVNAAEASPEVQPFLGLVEFLGQFLSSLAGGLPSALEIEYQGELAHEDTRLLTLSVLKGIFSVGLDEPVSYVNAPQLASERGLEVRETTAAHSVNFKNLVLLRTPEHTVGGTLAGASGREPRIVLVDGHWVEVPPAPSMLAVRNFDQPGMVGIVGKVLGDAGYSISSMAVSPREDDGTALMLLSVTRPIDREVVAMIEANSGIIYAKSVGSDRVIG